MARPLFLFFHAFQVVEKQRATFEFEVNEDDIEGRWLKNGVEIASFDERFSYVTVRKTHRLTINETYRSDAGEYTFIAGKNRSTVNLHVQSECTVRISINVYKHFWFIYYILCCSKV